MKTFYKAFSLWRCTVLCVVSLAFAGHSSLAESNPLSSNPCDLPQSLPTGVPHSKAEMDEVDKNNWECTLSQYGADAISTVNKFVTAGMTNNSLPTPIDAYLESVFSADGNGSETAAQETLKKNISNQIFKFATDSTTSDNDKDYVGDKGGFFKDPRFYMAGNKPCPLLDLQFGPHNTIACHKKSDFDSKTAACGYFEPRSGFPKVAAQNVAAGAVQAALAQSLHEFLQNSSSIDFSKPEAQACISSDLKRKYLRLLGTFKYLEAKKTEFPKKCFQNGFSAQNSSSSSSALPSSLKDLAVGDCSTAVYQRSVYRSINTLYQQLAACQIKTKALAKIDNFKKLFTPPSSASFMKESDITAQVNTLANGCIALNGKEQQGDCLRKAFSPWAYNEFKKAMLQEFPSFSACD